MARLLREQCQSKTGLQQREIRKAFRQAKQVGVGPQQIGLRKESHRTKQVRVAETAS
ncbi:hypothetical protein [Staphylococcus lugdunensis]|uniref:hypothetical protein n=1 Tax=Staphylococcus lugdunensis TaxID=28035 RepID=UPI001F56BB09|nr:hypothetical protein [Staphylococcus lugdunensis]